MAKEYIEREATIEAIMSDPPDAHSPSWYIDRIKPLSAADVDMDMPDWPSCGAYMMGENNGKCE